MGALLLSLLARPVAADHFDGSASGVRADPSTDINDLYLFRSSETRSVLIMTVSPEAGADARFSTTALYTFRTTSRPAFASPEGKVPYDIICKFDPQQRIACWLGGDAETKRAHFISGDASARTGLGPAAGHPLAGRVRIFAGRVRDHLFFNLAGWNGQVDFFRSNASTSYTTLPQVETTTCRAIPANPFRTGILNRIGGDANGVTANRADFFLGLHTLAIVVELDTALLGGPDRPIISAWAATYRMN